MLARQHCPSWSSGQGGAETFAGEKFFFAEYHSPHKQEAYHSAVGRFLALAEAEAFELQGISPGMVGQ